MDFEERVWRAEARVVTLEKQQARLLEMLKWYVEEDDTMTGGEWDEENAYWIEGKKKAEALIEELENPDKCYNGSHAADRHNVCTYCNLIKA